MSHHEALDAQQNGISVLLAEHSNTERGFLGIFKEFIESDSGVKKAAIEVKVTNVDKDPIQVI